VLQHATFLHPTSSLPKISESSPGSGWTAFGLGRVKVLGYLTVQLVSKISSLCDPDPPTLQTDRWTDDVQLQYRTLHYSASLGNNSNNNNHNDIYSAVIIAEPPREFTRFTVHAMNTEMAPGGRLPLDQANWLELQARLHRQPVNRIHHRHLLSLLRPKADTHFTVPRSVKG